MDTYTRNSRRRAVWILLTVLWMGVIFFFSAQNAEESSSLSGGITDFIAHLIRPDLDRLPETDQQAFLNQLSFFVRKGAHFSEYAVLGLLLTGLAGTFAWNRWIRGLFSWGIGTLYAVSDEFPPDLQRWQISAAARCMYRFFGSFIWNLGNDRNLCYNNFNLSA